MKNPVHVAVASRSFSANPTLRAELLERYEHVTFNDMGRSLSGRDLVLFLRGHEKAITALERLDAALFDALPELRVISKYGVGTDMLDLAAMHARGVSLGWTGGVNRRSVAEMTVSAAIALLHRMPQSGAEVRAGTWRQLKGRELSGRTVGIVGCGNIGKETARLMRAFGCRVLAHDILDFPEFYHECGVKAASMNDLLGEADVVTLHLPLDDSTRRIMNAKRLEAMRPGAVLINYARGGLVDEIRLKELLVEGRIAGAALDVFETEPPLDLELACLPTVLPTSHIGGSTEEAILAMGRAAIDGLDSALAPPLYPFWPGNDKERA